MTAEVQFRCLCTVSVVQFFFVPAARRSTPFWSKEKCSFWISNGLVYSSFCVCVGFAKPVRTVCSSRLFELLRDLMCGSDVCF